MIEPTSAAVIGFIAGVVGLGLLLAWGVKKSVDGLEDASRRQQLKRSMRTAAKNANDEPRIAKHLLREFE